MRCVVVGFLRTAVAGTVVLNHPEEMALLITFLTLYALITGWFFVALLRWTVRSERSCACGGALGNLAMIHGAKSCYPAVESLRAI